MCDYIIFDFSDSIEPRQEPEWYSLLTEREIQEIKFAQMYAKEFNHGTDGHNRLLLIAKLVDINNQDLIPPIK